MAQTQYKATGISADNADKIKDAGMAVTDVKWVNINNDNVVVTHEDNFDEAVFLSAIQSVDGAVTLSK